MTQMPVFVKIVQVDSMKQLLSSLTVKIEEVRTTLNKLAELSKEEQDSIGAWKSNFETANKDMNDITGHLYEPEKI
jgi:hypothetical protein